MHENELTSRIIGAAMKVHTELGPGVLERAYELCLVHELRKQGFRAEAQVLLPIEYDGITIDAGYRIDVLVEGSVVLELKTVQEILPIHEAQLLSYLRLSGNRLGLLINFHVVHLRDGIKRMVNDYHKGKPLDTAKGMD